MMDIQKQDTNSIVLIIIDQLRADYLKYLPSCLSLLPYSAVCDTDSLPSSTETMHTVISTEKNPKYHGFISKTTKNGRVGLKELIGKLDSGQLSSLASMGKSFGYDVYAVGGKPETIQVMGLPRDCKLMVCKEPEGFMVAGEEKDEYINNESFEERCRVEDVKTLDFELLDLSRGIMEKTNSRKTFFILTLPSLDFIGHEHGPHSESVKSHLTALDNSVSSLIRAYSNKKYILIGDHGCRNTARYVIELDSNEPRKMTVYFLGDKTFTLQERYFFDKKRRLDKIQYDGGILRAWFGEGADSLSEADVNFLLKYGCICSPHDMAGVDSEKIREIYNKSNHKNLGDIVVIAHNDATFCKHEWIASSSKKISEGISLDCGDLPLGEHGSCHPEDREVAFLSNHDFGVKLLKSIQIRNYLNEIMK